MRKCLLAPFCGLFLLLAVTASGQVSLTATGGTTSGSFSTLSAAFTAINAGTHTGVISITVSANVTESSSASLDSSGNPSGSSYTSVSVKPAAGTAVTISGSIAGYLINLNGADNVTIDGLNTGGASLTLQNTSTTSTTGGVRFINDATSNFVKNCTVKSAGSSLSNGIILFSTGLASGNDNNTVTGCNLDGGSLASSAIISSGTTTSLYVENSNNTISNNNIYDWFNAATGTMLGIYLNAGSSDFTISGNSLYQTSVRNVTVNSVFYGIYTVPYYLGDKHVISGNTFGGSAAAGAGAAMQLNGTGSFYAGFFGFYIQTAWPGNSVDNNTVKNISLSYAANTSVSNSGFYGLISGFNGTGSFTNNTVRDITLTNNLTAGYISFQAMFLVGRATSATYTPAFTVSNNLVSNISATSSVNADLVIYGIRLDASSGSNVTSSSIISNPSFTVNSNQVNNMTLTTASVNSFLKGISTSTTNGSSSTSPLWPKVTITNNTVNDITSNVGTASYSTGSAMGIHALGSLNLNNTTDANVISGNTVYNISSSNTADLANAAAGIVATAGIYTIDKNKVYAISNMAAGSTNIPIVVGISMRNAYGASVVKNNFVSLGTGQNTNTNFFGLLNSINSTAAINFYHNSVYIGGTGSSRNSIALYRGNEAMTTAVTSTLDIKNNILYNVRSGGAGKNYAIGSYGTGTWTSDGNVLVSSGNVSTLAFWNNADNDFATYKTNSGGDAASKSTSVNFVSTSTGDLHLTGVSNGNTNLIGVTGTGVTTDFDGETRRSWAPYIGGDEASIPLSVQLITFNGTREGQLNKLVWSTSSESNNKGFDLERSVDGKSFSAISFVATKADKGNSSTTLSYNFTDEKAASGTFYYRLKQVDNDGKSSYSNIVVLKGDKRFDITSVYPNPSKSELNLAISSDINSKGTISIIDMQGRTMKQIVVSFSAGDNVISLNVADLSTGSYLLRLVNDRAEIKTTQFIRN